MSTSMLTRSSAKRTVGQWVLIGVVGALLLGTALWILFFATGTPADPLFTDSTDFVRTSLNSLTVAGLYFVVAAGFTAMPSREKRTCSEPPAPIRASRDDPPCRNTLGWASTP